MPPSRGRLQKSFTLSPEAKKLLEDAAKRLCIPESFLLEELIRRDPRINSKNR
jgi:hypothetical protein